MNGFEVNVNRGAGIFLAHFCAFGSLFFFAMLDRQLLIARSFSL
jgi:hypothetical protein